MSVLRICLLGQVRIAHADLPSPVKLTHTVQALLAYPLLQRQRSQPRETLAGLFWGDYSQERARSCLNTTLWRLRQVLEPDGIPRGTYLLTISTDEVGFNLESDYWLDVATFVLSPRTDFSTSTALVQRGHQLRRVQEGHRSPQIAGQHTQTHF
jgi:DNA-binding SARP family transcriptional activator